MSTRREFLIASAAAIQQPAADPPKPVPHAPPKPPAKHAAVPPLDGFAMARRCSIVRTAPTPDFFEGMLLGNGDTGVCVTTRPDALVFHIGKSDSWDIRVSEEHAAEILPFAQFLELWERASAQAKKENKPGVLNLERNVTFFKEYTDKVEASYRKPWPRPWPCGIVYVHWDASRVTVLRQTLDLSRGHYTLELNDNGRPLKIEAFVNTVTGHLCVWSDAAAAIQSVAYYPNIDDKAQLPLPEIDCRARPASATFSSYQHFPATAPTEAAPHPPDSPKDRNFALHSVVDGAWTVQRDLTSEHPSVLLQAARRQYFRMDLTLFTPRDHAENVTFAVDEARRLAQISTAELQTASDQFWQDFWLQSAVEIKDEELQRLWYQNQYWLACCLRQGKLAPGLFGNWTSGSIGTAWHGDYHMNYNTQQVFWGVFSSNHIDQHLPYIELVESLLPMSQRYAQEKFGLPGAYFPHSAYPVPSQVVPYPAPPWGYEICETPWVVQSLWWHYLYTQDREILQRVYPLLKAAAQFIAAYVKRGEDGKYHVSPTVSPENWGCTVDYRLNRDCIMDLALIDFLLEAVVKASQILLSDGEERTAWQEIRSNLVAYPRTNGAAEAVWLDVPGAPAGWIYNVPVTLAPVFPGERIGLASSDDDLKIARQTAATIRLEGGNDLVYQPLIRARLATLDLEWFKSEVRYSQLPNGIANDRVRQTGGRYHDDTDFDFMMRMGVWTENLSLPVVLNECMLQSYTGVIRLFPNTQNLGPARFRNLRAVGAFLISAEWDGKNVSGVELISERGGNARLLSPWDPKTKVNIISEQKGVPARQSEGIVEFATRPGGRYVIAAGATAAKAPPAKPAAPKPAPAKIVSPPPPPPPAK
jgi:alpha-L-fucosidase 2